MKNKEQLQIITITYIIGILGSFIINYIKSSSPLLNSVLSSIKISTLLTLWWLFYFKIGWKLPLFRKLLYRINLNGTWFGIYKSKNIKSDKIAKGKIGLRINQDFLNISVNSFTEKYQNFSYSEELNFDEKSNTYGLVYVYSQKENHTLDLNQRNGTTELKVKNYKDTLLLEGEFWTVHGTKGKLIVSRVSENIVDTFSEAKELNETNENMEVKDEIRVY